MRNSRWKRRLLITCWVIFSFTSAAYASNAQKILAAINDYRLQHQLPALEWNADIARAAEQHSRDMASHTVGFGHAGFYQRVRKLYRAVPGSNGAAENVAYAERGTTQQIVASWFNSSGHRRNILGNFNLTGIGIATSGDTTYVTQIFMRT